MPSKAIPGFCPICGRVLPSQMETRRHFLQDHREFWKRVTPKLPKGIMSVWNRAAKLKVPEGYTETRAPYAPWFEGEWAELLPLAEEEARRYWENESTRGPEEAKPSRPPASSPKPSRPPAAQTSGPDPLALMEERLSRMEALLQRAVSPPVPREPVPSPSSPEPRPTSGPSPSGQVPPATPVSSPEGEDRPEARSPAPESGEEEDRVAADFQEGSFLQYLAERRIIPFHRADIQAEPTEEAPPKEAVPAPSGSPQKERGIPWFLLLGVAGALGVFFLLRKRWASPAAGSTGVAGASAPVPPPSSAPASPPPPETPGESYFDPYTGRFYSRKYPHLRFG